MTTPPRPLIKDEETPPPHRLLQRQNTAPAILPMTPDAPPRLGARAARPALPTSSTTLGAPPKQDARAAVRAPATSSKIPIALARRAVKVGANARPMPRNDHPVHGQSLAPPCGHCLRLSPSWLTASYTALT